MIQFNSKDTHLSLEWVSKSYQISYSIKVLHVRRKFSDVQEEYGANQQQAVPNSLCLKYFSVLSSNQQEVVDWNLAFLFL